MAIKKVKSYQVGWSKGSDVNSTGYGWIRLNFTDGGYENFSVSKSDHQGLVDILRNEKPVVWDESAGFLYTKSEEVGEEES